MIALHQLILPEDGLLPEPALYLHLSGGARMAGGALELPPGGRAAGDGWMNLFPRGVWQREAHLQGLTLRLRGEGRVAAEVLDLSAGAGGGGPGGGGPGRPSVVWRGSVELGPDGAVLPLTALPAAEGAGLTALAVTGGDGGARLDGAAFLAVPGPRPPVRLAIGITTFRREAAVAATAARICAFLDQAPEASDLRLAHLFVIDNGGTAAPAPHPRLTVIPNRNLGGAGGFARALAAARDAGFGHCLFMDDDAAIPMENLRRTVAFLRLARSDRAALAGAMISATRPAAMWENGAVFDRFCRPRFNGTDLTDPGRVAAMEEAAAAPKPPGFYGGFWYFAFPVAAVRHDPFPFFVRGDDISFSLANRFDVVTLPGVVAVQDDFGQKESPLTLYLDLRNHLHHHLALPGMEIGAWRTAGIAWRFVLRSLMRMHYASAAAQCLAWADVLAGPERFEADADMAARRADLAAIAAPEAWQDPPAPPEAPPRPMPPGRLKARLMQAVLNGHLIPFWRHLGAQRVVSVESRALTWPFWGAAGMRIVDAAGGRVYEVRHDKAKALAAVAQALRLTWAWWRAYPRLAAAYRAAYGPMTTPAAWSARFRGARP